MFKFIHCVLLIIVGFLIGCTSPPTATPAILTPTRTSSPSVGATPTPTNGFTRTPSSTPIVPTYPFVAAMPVPANYANMAGISTVRQQFSAIKALGFNLVAQSFEPTSTPYDWLAYLQAAEQANLAVIATFTSTPPVWKDSSFDLGVNEAFLKATQAHPAMYAFVIIDDPFNPKFNNTITSERLRQLYTQTKHVAPNTRLLVLFHKSIAKAETSNTLNVAFKSGQCDICVIDAYEFRNTGDGNRFRRDDLIAQQRVSRAVIKREAPQAQLWTTAQVFGATARNPGDETTWFYMPRADELQQLTEVLTSNELQQRGKLDGIIWLEWAWDWESRRAIQATLGATEFAAQREWIKIFARQLKLLP